MTALASEHVARPGREGNFVPRTHRRDRYDQCEGDKAKGKPFPFAHNGLGRHLPVPAQPPKGRKGGNSGGTGRGSGQAIVLMMIPETIGTSDRSVRPEEGDIQKGQHFPPAHNSSDRTSPSS